MRDFFMEISVEKDGKIVTLDTDDMAVNFYQKINGKKVRILDITCNPGVDYSETVVEFVGEDGDVSLRIVKIYSR